MIYQPPTLDRIPELYTQNEVLGNVQFLIGCLMESKSYRMLSAFEKTEFVTFCLTMQNVMIQPFGVAKPNEPAK